MTLTKGQRLAQYEILSPLGSGGMGEVYRARDLGSIATSRSRSWPTHVAADPEMRRRFETEARAVAALSHPCILAIYELAVVDGVPVAVMELLEGETLRAAARDRARSRGARRSEIGAVDRRRPRGRARASGVIHRDLKPENVFLTTDGAVKILDFGLALQRLELPDVAGDGPTLAHTAHGVVLGTFGYMSPEQVTGERVDGRSDIFALGCVLYEMLGGRRLFAGDTPQEVIAEPDARPRAGAVGASTRGAPPELRAIVVAVRSSAIRRGASSRRATWRWRCARCSPGRPRRRRAAAGRERAASRSRSCRSSTPASIRSSST